ncbi:MAG: IPT/TIG domain-containing protein, partial [Deltaproteobacteria bacterium]|nr:IPT/TIG domain-containing protein [Deltaproteobacteria bacterium]
SFPCGDLAIESANPVTQIQVLSCTLDPAAVGSDLHLRIAVGPLTSRQSRDRLSSVPPSIRPGTIRLGAGPSGSQVTGTMNGGDLISFEADHIGTRPELLTVNFGQSGGPYIYTCTAVTITGPLVTCFTPPASGDGWVFTVTALDQSSIESTDTFNYPPQAIIDRVSGCNDADLRTVDCATQGGQFLTLTGSGFTSDLRVLINGVPSTSTTVFSPTQAQFLLPPGTGDVTLTVITGLVVSTSHSVVSYAAPAVSSISGCTDLGTTTYACARTGGTPITIVGANFGAASARVTVGGALCTGVSHDPASPHTRLTCTLPAGAGTNQPVLVDNGRVSNPGRLSYAP